MTPSVTVTITALIDQMNSTVPVTAMNSNVRTAADVFILSWYVMGIMIVVITPMSGTVLVTAMDSDVRTQAPVFLLTGYVMGIMIVGTGQMSGTVLVTAMNSDVRTQADVFLLTGYVMGIMIVGTGQMRTVHVMSLSSHAPITLHLQRNVSASLLCVMDGMTVLMDQMRSTVIPTAL